MTELRKWVGFDPFEREMGYEGKPQTKLSLALTDSRRSLNKVARWKDAARHAPATAATGHMPFAEHRDCSQW